MQNQIQTVNFHNQSLITLQKDGIAYVAMKPICENIGLDWTAQRQRLVRDEVLNSTMVMITTVATDGKMRELLCLPIHYLNGWLFGVDTNRVKAEIKETLITYKKECYQALFDYWNNGVAVNHRLSSDDTLPLRNAINMATGILRLDYATIYKMVHQRFGVDEIKELSKEQVHQAVEYVHGLVLQHGRKPVDNAMLYDVLANSAVHLRDYVRLIKQMKGIMFFDDDMGRNVHDFVVNNVRDIAQLAHDMKLTNKYGKPMFEPNRINYYGGNAIIMN
ncbi:phage antirepressor N-terminal domain-containing protein [Moraxella haemolytica]|uniref:phage antirepressor N-terminal domain-containing protein n=1 Tax=Moraxella haemolytica TaxID=2904119 RepID=UPI0025430070|nr:phage antirepressor N-terminal domain-containing protein [Moraxella sp. ZY171148]WII95995.1 phage antirepressor N-terminal domain-containing protein [Moraxella sp. ZY171148]